ncbi:hypothetical protein NGC32_08575 [Kluyvera cryocrescens]|uniref:hypothetical protein n=1 Tax=Kluyvera cryocrescens TaxID=580 RepID=UPI002DBD8FB1|nr:hypothetical protein [Kluyvera cryocrescens]MEB7712783.1 hypothetical protein [Kluyvera cryocrescens]
MKKFVLLSALVLVGCGDSTPECGDKEVIDLAKQIITGNFFDNSSGLEPFKFFDASISNVRTSDFNKDIGRYTCKATFIGKAGRIGTENKSSEWNDMKREIVYTVQRNSEKQVTVEAQWSRW